MNNPENADIPTSRSQKLSSWLKTIQPATADPSTEKITSNILRGALVSLSKSGKKAPTTVATKIRGRNQTETKDSMMTINVQPVAVTIPNAICALYPAMAIYSLSSKYGKSNSFPPAGPRVCWSTIAGVS